MSFRYAASVLAACLAVLASPASQAANVAERSPFTQGQWSDPTRSGTGFEIFSVGNQAMATWFTFDDARNPVWYTAQGTLGESWTLLRHYWNGLSYGTAVDVGTLQLTFLDDSQALASFSVGGRTGTWRIEPFMPGAKSNEVDHSGSYFDPANPGWGYTLTEQGEVLGGVLYTYDQFGFPTWVAGFSRNSNGSVPVVSVRGPCPGCDPAPTDRFEAGRIDIEFVTDREVSLTVVLNDPVARGQGIDGARLVQLGRPAADRWADRLPARFASGSQLKSHLAAVMHNMAFGAVPQVYFPESQVDFPLRPQRLMDSGADECDIVKSSGRYVYTFGHDGVTLPMAYLRVARADPEGVALDVLPDTIPLSSGFNTPTYAASLCLGNDALVSIAGTQPYTENGTAGSSRGYMKGRTYVEIFGLTDPTHPASRWWAEFEGHVLTSFRIGERLYLVLRYAPRIQGLDYTFAPSSDAANQQVLADAPLSVLTPQVRINGGDQIALIDPSAVWLAAQGLRRRADFITVVAIDVAQARIVDALSILGPAESASVTGYELYLAGAAGPGTGIGNATRSQVTQVHLGLEGMSIAGGGVSEGLVLLNGMQAASTGDLRLYTGSRVNVLAPGDATPQFLHAIAALPNASRSDAIPASGALRFSGDRLYLGTSSGQLMIVDFSKRDDPQVAVTLDSRGPLESVHPLPDGELLATGHEVGFFGIPSNLHATLYDTRDLAKVREVQRLIIAPSNAATPLSAEPYALSIARQPDGAIAVAFPVTTGPARQGLAHLEVRDARSFNGGLARLPDLPAGAGPLLPNARALLYPEGLLFIGAGRFWRQDDTGNVTGPF